jgi:hypothetical protein
MPFVDPEPSSLRGVTGRVPAEPVEGDPFGAAFRQDNSFVSFVSSLRNSGSFTPDPNHNPIDVIRGTPYFQQHSDRFLGSRSEAETRNIMAQIDREDHDRAILAGAGKWGVVAGMMAGAIDPTMALPGGAGIKAGREGLSFARTAAEVGIAAGGAVTAQEMALHATQETRTVGESALNVASATILSALIGGAAARMMTREEHAATVAALDAERPEMAAHASGEPAAPREPATPAAAGASPSMAAAAGAAATDTRKLEVVPTGVGIEKLGFDPMSRLITSPAVSARRTAVDLAETPLRFKENLEGIPTTSGPSLDRLARLQIAQTRVAVGDELDRLFAEYRFGDADKSFPRMRAQFERLAGRDEGYMSMSQFKQEVSKALTQGDKHDIPQVQSAADFIRKNVFNPWKDRAIAAGLLPEGVEVKTADSYLQRVYNKQAIAARRPEFVNTIQSWLKSDQEAKAAAKDRLTDLNDRLQQINETYGKLQGRHERLTANRAKLEARIKERGGETITEIDRAEQLTLERMNTEEEIGGLKDSLSLLRDLKAQKFGPLATAQRKASEMLERRIGKFREQKGAAGEAGRSADLNQERLDELLSRKEHAQERSEILQDALGVSEEARGTIRAKIEEVLGRWEGKSATEAKAALKAREKYPETRPLDRLAYDPATESFTRPEGAPRLEGADAAVDRAVRRIIESDRDWSDAELRDRAHQIVERILGSPDGRLPYDQHLGGPEIGYHATPPEPPRGALAAREFNIPDELIRP